MELLLATGRFPEAAFFTRAYLPSQVSNVVKQWKADLRKVSQTQAEQIADPSKNLDLFDGFEEALDMESKFKGLQIMGKGDFEEENGGIDGGEIDKDNNYEGQEYEEKEDEVDEADEVDEVNQKFENLEVEDEEGDYVAQENGNG